MKKNYIVSATTGLDNEKDLKKLLIKLTDITKELLGADRCSIFIHDRKTDELFTFIAHGISELRISASGGIAGLCFTSGEVFNIPDAHSDSRYNVDSEKKTGYRCNTILSIPIITEKRETIGVFQVLNKLGTEPFSDEDVILLQQLSSYASSLLKRALEFRESIMVGDSEIRTIGSLLHKDEQEVLDKIESSIIPLRISDNPLSADVCFNYQNLQLEIYRIENNYFAVQKNDKHKIIINNYMLTKDVPVKVLYNADITIENYSINFEQLKSYFKVKLNPYNRKIFFLNRDQNGDILLELKESETSIIRVVLEKSLILLQLFNTELNLKVNREKITDDVYVNLNDEIRIDNKYFNIRKLVYEHLIEKQFYYFDPGVNEYIISNRNGNIIMTDNLDLNWSCKIIKRYGSYYFNKNNCPYEVFLNSALVKNVALQQGDKIYINGNVIEFDFVNNVFEKSKFSFRNFLISNLKHTFIDRSVGLDEISFCVEHGELVSILGPSGCGKTTMLNIINGSQKPTAGEVLIDNTDLHKNYDFLKNFLGFVPQDDLLFENLTVYENLYFNAKLRFPGKDKKSINSLIDRVLKEIGLLEKKNIRVGDPLNKTLSGGERKRINIGLELLSDSEIFLLDEPTSGLSSKDSEKIVEILKKISLSGKIVFVIIHQPSSKIFKMFDKVVLLDRGGRLAFYGGIYDGLKYFRTHSDKYNHTNIECPVCRNVEPDLLLEILEEPLKDKDGTPLPQRKHSPEYWKKEYRTYLEKTGFVKMPAHEQNFIPPKRKLNIIDKAKQFSALLERNFLNKLKDRSNLVITFLEAPMLGLVIGFLLKYIAGVNYSLYDNKHLITFIFLSVIVSLFLAMTNSADEIIRDASILLREKMLDIKISEYYVAKYLTLLLFAFFQNFLFLIVSTRILELKELFSGYLILLTLVSMSGISIGLFISAIPRLTSKAAQNLIPLILVPQIIFGGFLVRFEDINKTLSINKDSAIPEICQIMPSRWGFEGIVVLQEKFSSFNTNATKIQEELDDFVCNDKKYIAQLGEEKYFHKKMEMMKDKTAFNKRYKKQFGNRSVHDVVDEGMKQYYDFLEMNSHQKKADSDAIVVYPMYVVEKKNPFDKQNINTVYYNGGVLLLITFILGLLSLLMLKFRESIIRLQQTVIHFFSRNIQKKNR